MSTPPRVDRPHRCQNCAAFCAEPGAVTGHCHLHPPREWTFPPVHMADWCLDWEKYDEGKRNE